MSAQRLNCKLVKIVAYQIASPRFLNSFIEKRRVAS